MNTTSSTPPAAPPPTPCHTPHADHSTVPTQPRAALSQNPEFDAISQKIQEDPHFNALIKYLNTYYLNMFICLLLKHIEANSNLHDDPNYSILVLYISCFTTLLKKEPSTPFYPNQDITPLSELLGTTSQPGPLLSIDTKTLTHLRKTYKANNKSLTCLLDLKILAKQSKAPKP